MFLVIVCPVVGVLGQWGRRALWGGCMWHPLAQYSPSHHSRVNPFTWSEEKRKCMLVGVVYSTCRVDPSHLDSGVLQDVQSRRSRRGTVVVVATWVGVIVNRMWLGWWFVKFLRWRSHRSVRWRHGHDISPTLSLLRALWLGLHKKGAGSWGWI
jgi:hypothetical protein